MADSTVQSIDTLIAGFPHQQIPPIIGKPTHQNLWTPLKLLSFNAQSLVRPDGADEYGHKNLIRADISYLSLPQSAALPVLAMPPNPIFGGTQAEISERQYYHSIDKTNDLNQVAYKGAFKQQLISLVPPEFLDDLNHHITGFNAVTPKQIVAHRKTKYAKITPAMMEKNSDKFRDPLDLSTPIETWIKKMLLCQEYALEGGDPITDVGIINNGYLRFNESQAFVEYCKLWKNRAAATKTWAQFVIDFTKSYNEYSESQASMRAAGIANNAEQLQNNKEEFELVATLL